ncbi:MAG: flagellar motor stator protein MotA [Rickettsiales bacterium]|jgi:chemotaxis protein MotA|nr:flagellar motor stator protein MotA [Rickettsiales bacterium]|tara:strand:- start:865 stop:1725 length:861 start_codon:yes stop_codon:yes gene_type:complete
MFVIIGLLVVIGSIIGGYLMVGGHLAVLWQPAELVIIGGSGLGAFIAANSKETITGAISAVIGLIKGPKYKADDYLELLTLQYQVFRTARSKGMLALESHIDNPETSDLFNQFPNFASDHHAVEFFCDYLRLMTLGTDNPLEVETLIDQELEVHHEHKSEVSHAVNIMAESFPGLGIVAAVLGVIHTMGIITEPPEILGAAIGAALVGTFLGILLCYGFVGPIAVAMKGICDADHNYYVCLKTGIIAHLQGYAPAVSVEFARKTLGENNRPSFAKLEETTATITPF